MHSYRDAIRDTDLRRAVRYAAILYPGPEVRYADERGTYATQATKAPSSTIAALPDSAIATEAISRKNAL